MSLHHSASASPLHSKICLMWVVLMEAFTLTCYQTSVSYLTSYLMLYSQVSHMFCSLNKYIIVISDHLLTSIVYTGFSNTVSHQSWSCLHVCVWESSWFEILKCYLSYTNDVHVRSCLITEGITNRYIMTEPNNMHSGMLCLPVSLCILSHDNLVSSLTSFGHSPGIKMGFKPIQVHECFMI